jgi:hypothetical protein
MDQLILRQVFQQVLPLLPMPLLKKLLLNISLLYKTGLLVH